MKKFCSVTIITPLITGNYPDLTKLSFDLSCHKDAHLGHIFPSATFFCTVAAKDIFRGLPKPNEIL